MSDIQLWKKMSDDINKSKREKEIIERVNHFINIDALYGKIYGMTVDDLVEYQNVFKDLLNLYLQEQAKNKELTKKLYLCTPEIPQHQHGEYISYVELVNRLYDEKEKNKELFEEYNKRVNTIIKYEQGIKEFIDETHITDIEPWSIYKINGGLLFNLEQLLEED